MYSRMDENSRINDNTSSDDSIIPPITLKRKLEYHDEIEKIKRRKVITDLNDSIDSYNSDEYNSDQYDYPDESSSSNESTKSINNTDESISKSNIDEYFDIDADPLIGIIVKKLNSEFPELDENKLRDTVKNAIIGASIDLIEEYCSTVPNDKSWKTGLEESVINELESQLKELRDNIKKSTPTIPLILKSNLTQREKERALQLYDIINNMEPYSMNYIELKARVMEMIKCAPKDKEHDNEQLDKLYESICEEMPTVEKIITSKITKSDKISALKLYESMQQCYYKSGEWFDIQRRINYILKSELESEEAVNKLEIEEDNLQASYVHFTTDLKRKIFELDADPDIKSRIYSMYCDMMSRTSTDHGYNEIRDKILWAIKLPYRRKTTANIPNMNPESIREYCIDAFNKLNDEIYGMDDAKMRIIQTLNDRIYNPTSRSLLALKGEPGVGKTKLAKTIAKISGRPFDKISLGGSIDSTIFKGSDNVWSGASPSLLLQILSRVKYSNAIILLDEFDKLGSTEKGIEVQNSLLHVLDPTQNKEFQDAFLNEFHHDISNIWFIPAMNDDSLITPALRDRLDIIEIPTYNKDEMVQIIKRHTLPEALVDKGIDVKDITITDQASYNLLNKLGSEVKNSGMRPVEKAINNIVSRINFLRTMYSNDDTHNIPISYKLKDFNGFPYTITADSIDVLQPQLKETSLSYFI